MNAEEGVHRFSEAPSELRTIALQEGRRTAPQLDDLVVKFACRALGDGRGGGYRVRVRAAVEATGDEANIRVSVTGNGEGSKAADANRNAGSI